MNIFWRTSSNGDFGPFLCVCVEYLVLLVLEIRKCEKYECELYFDRTCKVSKLRDRREALKSMTEYAKCASVSVCVCEVVMGLKMFQNFQNYKQKIIFLDLPSGTFSESLGYIIF